MSEIQSHRPMRRQVRPRPPRAHDQKNTSAAVSQSTAKRRNGLDSRFPALDAKPRTGLAGRLEAVRLARNAKAAAASAPTIDHMLAFAQYGLIDRKSASRFAKKIEHSPQVKTPEQKALRQLADKNLSALESRKQEFQQFRRDQGRQGFRKKQRTDDLRRGVVINRHLDHLAQIETDVQRVEKNERLALHALDETFAYINQAEKDLQRLTELSNKLQKKGQLSTKEQKEFNQNLWAYKENIPILQNYLTAHRARLGDESGAGKILDAALVNIADKHMAIADLMTLHSDHLPERPAMSRDQRFAFHILETQAARAALKNIKANYGNVPNVKAMYDHIDAKLAHHEAMLSQMREGKLPEHAHDFHLLLNMPIGKQRKIPAAMQKKLGQQFLDNKNLPIALRGITQGQLLNIYLTHEFKARFADAMLPDVAFLQKQGMIDVLNHRDWGAINKKIEFGLDGRTHRVKSTITPAGALSDRLERPYVGHGITSKDRLQYRHAINLAHSTLKNSAGETLFAMHRSGVLDSFDMTPKNLAKLSDSQLEVMMKDLVYDRVEHSYGSPKAMVQTFREYPARARELAKIMRSEASKDMAKDMAATMLLNDPKLLARALKGETVDLPITSISLLTPDYLTGLGSKVGEQDMLAHHRAAIEALSASAEPLTLSIKNARGQPTEVKLRVRPRVINFGVNFGALRTFGILRGNPIPAWRRAMGWELVAPANNQALTELIGARNSNAISGAAGAKIAELQRRQIELRSALQQPGPQTQRQAMQKEIDNNVRQISKITQSSQQLKYLWRRQDFVREGRDPYKMPARLAILIDAIDEKPLIHCKSGLDRTGQLDAEGKYLSARFDADGQLPQPDVPPDAVSRRLRTQFALGVGSHEMQEYNSGLPGYKLKGVPSLNAQFERFALPTYQGGASLLSGQNR